MTFTKSNVSNPAYEKAVKYVNSTLQHSDPVSNEQWNRLAGLLFNSSNSIVSFQVTQYLERRFGNTFDSNSELIYDLVSDFCLFYYDKHSLMNSQLQELRSRDSTPGDAFLQWLLNDCLTLVIKQYAKQKNLDARAFVYLEDSEGDKDPKAPSDQDDSLVPDSFVRDKQERAEDPVRFTNKTVVQDALIAITQLMKDRSWRLFDYFIQPGLQMYPHLDCCDIELEFDESDLCRQLKENAEAHVARERPGYFSASSYLMEIHDFAQRNIAQQREKFDRAFKKTRNFSDNRRYVTRRLVELAADSLLAPLDNKLIAEICHVTSKHADTIIFRYKNTFLKGIYDRIKDYQEDKDI